MACFVLSRPSWCLFSAVACSLVYGVAGRRGPAVLNRLGGFSSWSARNGSLFRWFFLRMLVFGLCIYCKVGICFFVYAVRHARFGRSVSLLLEGRDWRWVSIFEFSFFRGLGGVDGRVELIGPRLRSNFKFLCICSNYKPIFKWLWQVGLLMHVVVCILIFFYISSECSAHLIRNRYLR